MYLVFRELILIIEHCLSHILLSILLFKLLSHVTIFYSIITDKVVTMASKKSGQSSDVKSNEKPMSHAATGIILMDNLADVMPTDKCLNSNLLLLYLLFHFFSL